MVTNLPPEALAQYRRVVGSKSKEEKLKNLRIYLSMIPRHKGTGKLLVQVKRQISKLEDEIENDRMKGARHRSVLSLVPNILRSKSTVVVLAVGESVEDSAALVCKIQGISTKQEHVKLPDLKACKFEGMDLVVISITASSVLKREIIDVVGKTDLVAIFARDLNEMKSCLITLEKLSHYNIFFVNKFSRVNVQSLGVGTNVVGKSNLVPESEILRMAFGEYKQRNIRIEVSSMSTGYALRSALVRGTSIKPILAILPKGTAMAGNTYPTTASGIVPDIVQTDFDEPNWKENLSSHILTLIGKIRIFTEDRSSRCDSSSILLDENASVKELAESIHRDMLQSFRDARITRPNKNHWLRVGLSFKLRDRDIVEIRAR
jgi:ribosome-interacting GTPase 1